MRQAETNDFGGMISVAPQMTRLFELVRRVARTDASVLVRGETGTGKEMVAKAVHDLSPRADKPFRAINCATLTPELLASELFGHVKGAFTGAVKDRRGLFRLADGGTLFLDEIAEIPLDLQARLLRVLQEQKFVPLGGTEPVQVDVRLVSATHRSLRAEVEAGRFREDLMYRIRVVPLFLPPLRERDGDIEALTRHFIAEFNDQGFRHVEQVSDEATRALLRHRWPGNVRELSNVLEYAFAVGEGPELGLDDLTPELRGEGPPPALDREMTVVELERQRIIDALREARGRKSEAAQLLGMSRSTLWRKLREHKLQ
ncbi:MAG: sigma 54-interacting transcriptional regulator [Deltaproteobacteria bacterium]|nr:sigma 54-interacting transcriptional regulator [Deltaproteobacteria bacterium]